MLELYAETLAAFLLLAAASYRFRRDARIDDHAKTVLRGVGAVLLLLALVRAETAMDGERLIRLLVASSLAAATVVLALSAWPTTVLRPVYRTVRLVKR